MRYGGVAAVPVGSWAAAVLLPRRPCLRALLPTWSGGPGCDHEWSGAHHKAYGGSDVIVSCGRREDTPVISVHACTVLQRRDGKDTRGYPRAYAFSLQACVYVPTPGAACMTDGSAGWEQS